VQIKEQVHNFKGYQNYGAGGFTQFFRIFQTRDKILGLRNFSFFELLSLPRNVFWTFQTMGNNLEIRILTKIFFFFSPYKFLGLGIFSTIFSQKSLSFK